MEKCWGCGLDILVDRAKRVHCSNCGLSYEYSLGSMNYENIYSGEHQVYGNLKNYISMIHQVGASSVKGFLLPTEKEVIRKLKKAKEVKTVLDFGCGTGRLLRAMSIEGVRVFGVEVSLEMRSFLTKNGYDVRSSIDDFVEGDNIDAVIFSEVAEHLENPYELLRYIVNKFRVKKIIIIVPFSKFRSMIDSEFRDHDVPPNHLSWWTLKSLQIFLGRFGSAPVVFEVRGDTLNIIRKFAVSERRKSKMSRWASILYLPKAVWFFVKSSIECKSSALWLIGEVDCVNN